MTTETPAEHAAERRHPFLHLGHPDDHIPMFEVPDYASPLVGRPVLAIVAVLGLGVACLGWGLGHLGEAATAPAVHGAWTLPFALLLASIAIMPFAAKHFWEKYYAAVSVGLGAIVALYYVFGLGATANMAKTGSEYISFIVLLGSLFTVSGGILIRVRRTASPALNTGLLLVGAILANVFGTTGAAMLLIRPYLRMNRGHMRPYHIIFFIFAIANVGGALTPIGDPPLFLGYLKGVPFWWVLQQCWLIWAVAVGLILGIFFVLEWREVRKTERQPHVEGGLGPMVSLFGAGNVVFVAMILAGVFLDSPFREGLMVLAAIGSLWTTPRRIHVENHFNFAPIKEVALLFIGIFATMVPALNYLYTHASDERFKTYLATPGQYYFMTGALSSVLDNAPTYLTYLESQLGKTDPVLVERAKHIIRKPVIGRAEGIVPDHEDLAGLNAGQQDELRRAVSAIQEYHGAELRAGKPVRDDAVEIAFLLGDPRKSIYLMAISLGAVFFGACTYIGNGPNFMVKSIAEHAGAKCPSFFGYIVCYTLPVLLPVFILVWALFLRSL